MKHILTVVEVEQEGAGVVVQVIGDNVRGALLFPGGASIKRGEQLELDVTPQATQAAKELREKIPPAPTSTGERIADASRVLQAMLFGGAAPVVERDVDAEMDALLGPPRP